MMDEPQIKREMPRSIEAEEMVLGSMLLDNDNIAVVENIVMPEDFSAHGKPSRTGFARRSFRRSTETTAI